VNKRKKVAWAKHRVRKQKLAARKKAEKAGTPTTGRAAAASQ
jgi:hypothetical protein